MLCYTAGATCKLVSAEFIKQKTHLVSAVSNIVHYDFVSKVAYIHQVLCVYLHVIFLPCEYIKCYRAD